MKRRRSMTRSRGFTLIEVLIAMAILAIGMLGVFAAYNATAQTLRDGQLSQYRMVLLDASLERLALQNKTALFQTPLFAAAAALPVPTPDQIAVGAAPWVIDPSLPDQSDSCGSANGSGCVNTYIGTGALFEVLSNGDIIPCFAPGVPSQCLSGTYAPAALPASCADATIPGGIYCREVAVTTAMENSKTYVQDSAGTQYPQTGNFVVPPVGSKSYTLWVRIHRVGTSSNLDSLVSQVFIQ